MSLSDLIGRTLGLEDTQQIVGVARPSLKAAWAHDAPAWLFFGCLALAAAAIVFYLRFQSVKHRKTRIVLGLCRAVVLMLLLLTLAEPYISLTVATRLRPALCLLFDGTDSMGIADDLPEADRTALATAVGLTDDQGKPTAPAAEKLSRMDYVKAWLRKKDGNLLGRLEKEFRLQAYLFDRPAGVRLLELAPEGRPHADGKHLAGQLTSEGQVTAIGSALLDLQRRNASGDLAGVVVISDFGQNSGPPPLDAAKGLGAKVYTVGVGPAETLDVAVDLQAPLIAKKDERTTLVATLKQVGLLNQTVHLKLSARELGGDAPADAAPTPLAEKSVQLTAATVAVDLPYLPKQTGRFELIAEVDPVEGEVVKENNVSRREITVRDDYIRLLFVEYEPTYEWRFIKEVFHRDKLVGMRGFRTFLRSSDPKVRQKNELFLPTMSPPRNEFFAYDVIMLGDMPATAISPRFCQMTEEFVGTFGGGLVVMAGPRFGPGQLADTLLGKMLPVVVNPTSRIRDRAPFTLQLRAEADQVDFMQMGANKEDNAKAWKNLGPLPWYQPVERFDPMMTRVLAEHPTDMCADGKTNQPLIAMRRYGRGEVIYLGFDEMWRLRRQFGELYYRQFWGQMIHRLALSHALGNQKRFVVRTDRRKYMADDQVLLSIDAFDKDFQPLGEEMVPGGALRGELILPERAEHQGAAVQPIAALQLRKGVFEARFPVFAAGEHRVRIKDPVTDQFSEVTFQVTAVSVERQHPVRNVALQETLAGETNGKSYDLTTVDNLMDDIRLAPKIETHEWFLALWNTRLFFGCVVLLLLAEWLVRKRIHLP